MDKLETLKNKVASLYGAKNPNRSQWTDWLYDQHVRCVADNARSIARTHGADPELSEAAALLHDIADFKMSKRGDAHEQESLRLAREIMEEAGYADEQIKLVVDDAIRFHSCHGDERPKSLEGQVLATADSVAHLKTDFYLYAAWAWGRDRDFEAIKEWTLEKIERDLNVKIFFDDVRESARPDYEIIKNLFSRAPLQ